MVHLCTVGADRGMASAPEVVAPYATLEEALMQADEDLRNGLRVLRIEDAETREVLWTPDAPTP